jgi:HlyD family secretion protein
MKKIVYSAALAVIIAVTSTILLFRPGRANQVRDNSLAPVAESKDYIAAPGRVEPLSEEIKIGAELSGKLKAVLVDEGDHVECRQMVALLNNDDFQAQAESAEAQLHEAEAELESLINGSRQQERHEAQATVDEMKALMNNAKSELDRRQALFQTGDIAKEQVERAERDYEMAVARYNAASQRHLLIAEGARAEDRAKATAAVQRARARLQEARAQVEKTVIRSPISGVVLRRYLKSGESVANSPNMPIVTVADTAKLRVRVDVDESDIGMLSIGQRVYFIAPGYSDRKFWGRVVRIGQILGKKNARTDEPTERVDTKILETLVELEDGHQLYPGLRVDSFIEVLKPR